MRFDDNNVRYKNLDSPEQIKQNFESESVLTLTHEVEKDNQLAFHDFLVTTLAKGFGTSVKVKNTKSGTCLNYKSTCPDSYKLGVINIYLHKAYHVSSSSEQ